MALEETLSQLTTHIRRSEYCAWAQLLERLSDKDKKVLENALDKGLPFSIIIKALRKEGYNTSNDSMRNHMKGNCRCPKS